MKLSIGIVGLPNVGKSTLFQELTKQQVNIANYPFTTINPNVGVVAIENEQLHQVAKVMDSKQIFPAALEFVDIAGLVKGAHQGAGLGNQFLSHIREVHAIIHLVRVFKDKEIVHFEAEPSPIRDFETVLEELRLKDESSREKMNLLSTKPELVILNGEPQEAPEELVTQIRARGLPHLVIDLGESLTQADFKNIFQGLISLLDLIVFYTANENEARSWFVKSGTKAPQAAGVVHTDFERTFVRAEVINSRKLVESGSWQAAHKKGLIRTEGKDYLVQDGDVMVVKHG